MLLLSNPVIWWFLPLKMIEYYFQYLITSQQTFTGIRSTIETPEKSSKYVQS